MRDTSTKLPVNRGQDSTASSVFPFNMFRLEVDRLFDDFANWRRPFQNSSFSPQPFSAAKSSFYAPAIDVADKKDAFEITAEIPGMEEKDIEVTLSNGGLSIRGEKKADREEKNKDYYLSERSYGSFDRYFTLPQAVDAEKISASFKNGILTVMLPKTPEARSEKKIPIKGN